MGNARPIIRDPRRAGGKIVAPDLDSGRGDAVLDTRQAVLKDETTVAMANLKFGEENRHVIGLELGGRINKSTDRAQILFLFDPDGAAAIITELVGICQRAGGDVWDELNAAIGRRMGALPE